MSLFHYVLAGKVRMTCFSCCFLFVSQITYIRFPDKNEFNMANSIEKIVFWIVKQICNMCKLIFSNKGRYVCELQFFPSKQHLKIRFLHINSMISTAENAKCRSKIFRCLFDVPSCSKTFGDNHNQRRQCPDCHTLNLHSRKTRAKCASFQS